MSLLGIQRPTIRRVLVLKAVIALGILAQHFLPPEKAVVASITANLLWLVAL